MHRSISACWSNAEKKLTCKDGTSFSISSSWGWPSCENHGGRAKCPSHWPYMCNDKTNYDNMRNLDYWCKQSASDCASLGGLRGCTGK